MMDFDRAMNVRVNGKEVKRVAINGVTIWEKYIPANILLESDKPYASEGDNINLTATVNDKFGRVCPGKNVEFYLCDQILRSVEEPQEVTRGSSYPLTEDDYTNKSIEFKVDAASRSVYIFTGHRDSYIEMNNLQVGDVVKIVDDGVYIKGYINDIEFYSVEHVPGLLMIWPVDNTLTFSHFTEKGMKLFDSAITNDNGVATVSYSVQDTEPLNIRCKCGTLLSEIFELKQSIIVTSDVELDVALTNANRGDTIYIQNGTYTLSKSYNIPCVNIIGEEENPPILQVSDKWIVTTDSEFGVNTFENLQFRGTIGGLRLSSAYASAEIRNCNWKNMVNQYNFTAIYITNHNEDKYVLIENCEFINNYTTGYGHYCTNINCVAPNGAKNITVRNCVFNSTRNCNTSNVQTKQTYGVAVNHKAEWENSLTYATASNCYFCNNQYLHARDSLYGFTSNNNCP